MEGEWYVDPCPVGPHEGADSRPEMLPAGVSGWGGLCCVAPVPSGWIGDGAAEFAKEDAIPWTASHDARVSSTPLRCPRRLGLGAGSPRVLASLRASGIRRSGTGGYDAGRREAGGWMSGVNLFDNALFVGASVEGNSSQCGVSRAGDAPRGQEVDLALPSGAGLRAHRGGWREGPPERTSPVCSVPM